MNKIKSLFAIGAIALTGCITSKAPDGTVTKQVDTQAIATATAVAIEILHDPAVSNAIFQATQPK